MTSTAIPGETTPAPEDWWGTFRRRKWSFWAAFAVACGCGTWSATTLRPLYRARARLVVTPPGKLTAEEDKGARLAQAFAAPVENPATHAQLLADEGLHTRARREGLPSPDAVRDGVVRVEHTAGSEVVDLIVEATSPDRAAALATRIVTLYAAEVEEGRSRILRNQMAYLNQERTTAQAELNRIEKRLLRLQETGGLRSPGDGTAEIGKLRLQIAALWEVRQATVRKIAQTRDELHLHTREPAGAEPDRPEESGTAPSTSPTSIQLAQHLQALETNLRTTERQARQAKAALVVATAAEVGLQRRRREANHLQQRRETVLATVRALTERLVGLQAGGSQLPAFRSVEPASVPSRPFWPNPAMQVAVVLAGALCCGTAMVVVRERLGSFVNTAKDVERAGLSLLGVLPARPSGRAIWDTATPSKLHPVLENLEYAGIPQRARTLLVLEAGPVFTSSVTETIGGALASAGKRVVLVDADLRSGGRSDLRGEHLAHRVGLSQVLAGLRGEDEVLSPTDVIGLWLLPAGPIPPNPADLLGSAAAGDLLDRLKERFDVVIVRGSLHPERTDTLRLAEKVDGVLLGVQTRGMRVDQLRKWGEHVSRAGGAPLGVILRESLPSLPARENYKNAERRSAPAEGLRRPG